jgi:hypothetical protein
MGYDAAPEDRAQLRQALRALRIAQSQLAAGVPQHHPLCDAPRPEIDL